MRLVRLRRFLDEIEGFQYEEEKEDCLDVQMLQLVINNLGIKYLQCKENYFTILDLMSIKYVEIYPGIYQIRENKSQKYGELKERDLILNLPHLSPADINYKDINICYEFHVLRMDNGQDNYFHLPVHVSLRDVSSLRLQCEKKAMNMGLCYIAIPSFSHFNINEVIQKTRKPLVIDLRGNCGGKLNDMKKVFEMFFPESCLKGVIMKKGMAMDFQVEGILSHEFYSDIYLVINRSTSSAAEIFALLCRYYCSATLVGLPSYGKNIVCREVEEEGLCYTVPCLHYTVAGHEVNEGGIEPDIILENIDDWELHEFLEACK